MLHAAVIIGLAVLPRQATSLGAAAAARTSPAQTPESYTLSQAVIVQVGDSPRVYFPSLGGDLQAVDVQTGAVRWHSTKVVVPLIARADRLLALLRDWLGRPTWTLAVLDARQGEVLATLPAWADGAPTMMGGWVGSGTVVSSRVEGIARDSEDYVVWHVGGEAHSPVPQNPPPPVRHWESSGAVRVDLRDVTVVPVQEPMAAPAPELRADSLGFHIGPYAVGDVSVTAAGERVGRTIRIILRRERRTAPLPTVTLCNRAGEGSSVSMSADGRHILGTCVEKRARRPRARNVVYDAASAVKVAEFLDLPAPASFLVWRTALIYVSGADSVGAIDLARAKRRFALPYLNVQRREYPQAGPLPPRPPSPPR